MRKKSLTVLAKPINKAQIHFVMNAPLINYTAPEKTPDQVAHQAEEVLVKIGFWNGETIEKRFAHCEDAWQWQKDESKKRANRREKADRVQTRWSFYCGCTITGKEYGGWLVGYEGMSGAENLEWSKQAECNRVKKLKSWGVTV